MISVGKGGAGYFLERRGKSRSPGDVNRRGKSKDSGRKRSPGVRRKGKSGRSIAGILYHARIERRG